MAAARAHTKRKLPAEIVFADEGDAAGAAHALDRLISTAFDEFAGLLEKGEVPVYHAERTRTVNTYWIVLPWRTLNCLAGLVSTFRGTAFWLVPRIWADALTRALGAKVFKVEPGVCGLRDDKSLPFQAIAFTQDPQDDFMPD